MLGKLCDGNATTVLYLTQDFDVYTIHVRFPRLKV
ncbi:hypothetical protein EMIT043CA1_70184 [Pseudomonas brassicacearum]